MIKFNLLRDTYFRNSTLHFVLTITSKKRKQVMQEKDYKEF